MRQPLYIIGLNCTIPNKVDANLTLKGKEFREILRPIMCADYLLENVLATTIGRFTLFFFFLFFPSKTTRDYRLC